MCANGGESELDVNYKLRVIVPVFPTFKPARTFLDICLADSTLRWLNDLSGKARTFPYDSEHTALSLVFEAHGNSFPLANPASLKYVYNYKTTKWCKFTKKLPESCVNRIPFDNNLTVTEIDAHLQTITNAILDYMSSTVPTYKRANGVHKYLNHRIKQLQKDKSYLVSLLHKLHIIDPSSQLSITRKAKVTLKKITNALQLEFKSVIGIYWTNIIKNIDYRKSDSFFPKVNSIFRPRKSDGIKDIHIDSDNTSILDRSGCNLQNLPKIKNKYVYLKKLTNITSSELTMNL